MLLISKVDQVWLDESDLKSKIICVLRIILAFKICLFSSYIFSLAAYYRGAMGILLVYDVTDESSFNSNCFLLFACHSGYRLWCFTSMDLDIFYLIWLPPSPLILYLVGRPDIYCQILLLLVFFKWYIFFLQAVLILEDIFRFLMLNHFFGNWLIPMSRH